MDKDMDMDMDFRIDLVQLSDGTIVKTLSINDGVTMYDSEEKRIHIRLSEPKLTEGQALNSVQSFFIVRGLISFFQKHIREHDGIRSN